MSHLRLLRIWLVALVVALFAIAGCGGHSDDPFPDHDAATDANADARRDATDGGDGPGSDARTDASDARPPTVDARADVRDAPPVIDVRVDVRPPDARPDVIDARPDVPDARFDVADVAVDRSETGPFDAPDAGCISDTQCPTGQPHCNVTTGACVARVSIAVTPVNLSIAAGTSQQYQATVTYSDNSTGNVTALAAWQSTTTSAVMSTTTPGLATGQAPGLTLITATFGGLVGSTQLTVTTATLSAIQVTPSNASSVVATTRQFTATGTYTDNSTQDLTATATWASSDNAIATIAAGGVATAVLAGSTMISATVGTVTGTVSFTVTAATLVSVSVTPANTSIATLTTQDFVATGVYSDNSTQDLTSQVTWGSSVPSIATIGNDGATKGQATGVAAGVTTISAAFGTISGSTQLIVTGASLTSIAVTPANPTVALGLAVPFTATGTFSDGSTQPITSLVYWSSSADAVASISNASGSEGLATTLSAGVSTITASLTGVTGASVMTVTAKMLTSIAVSPVSPSIAKGTTQQFAATGTYSDASTADITAQVNWNSADTGVATVSNASGSHGFATGVNTGTSTITASMGTVSGSTVLTVSPATLIAITLTPAGGSTAAGNPVPFTATGTYSDTSTQNITALVTWSSSVPTVASISNAAGSEGLATAVAAGTTVISATSGTVVGSTNLTVF